MQIKQTQKSKLSTFFIFKTPFSLYWVFIREKCIHQQVYGIRIGDFSIAVEVAILINGVLI